ncbi:MAG TPA: glycosyltransferase family 4 protein [Glaciibacter sp.]|nr:glycosyltransferase family 4 protein [Glaciibacter sp.]
MNIPLWLVAATALAASLMAPLALRPALTRFNVVDTPNARSSHFRPVLRGGGIGPLFAMALAYTVAFLSGVDDALIVPLGCIIGTSIAAGVLGWLEDVRGLSVSTRAVMQILIGSAGAGLAVWAGDGSYLHWLVCAIGVAGYINVTNFMDGVNGMSSLHGLVVGAAYATLGILTALDWLTVAGLVLAAAFLGFLPWNLLGRGLFLGDVGSYLLGGGVAIIAAGAWVAGVPLVGVVAPLAIYASDTTVTLLRRVATGEKWYEPHRSHTYQRLTDAGVSHFGVSAIVAVASAICAAVGLLSVAVAEALFPVLAGLILVVVACYFIIASTLGRRSRQQRRSTEVGIQQ